MNLSRRSLLVSVVLHCSLFVGGYFFISRVAIDAQTPLEQGEPSKNVVVREIQLAEKSRTIDNKVDSFEESESGERTLSESPSQSVSKEQSSSSTNAPPPPTQSTRALTLGPAYPTAPQARPLQKKVETSAPKASPSPAPASSDPIGWGGERKVANKKSGEGGNQSRVTRRARPTSRPEFNLGKRFPNLTSVTIKAEFKIGKDGSFEPTLLTSSGDPTADVVILGRLLEFEWLPALEKGVPVEDVRVMDITLQN